MKAILISDHAYWCALMMNGKKTIEVRTSKALYKATQKLIDEYGYAEFYVYCTKGKPRIVDLRDDAFYLGCSPRLNGKVVAKFTLKKCQEWHNYSWFEITEKGCVSDDELRNYSKGIYSLYIWHIDNLEIFDKPKELCEFIQSKRKNYDEPQVQKAPQSYCFIKTEDK